MKKTMAIMLAVISSFCLFVSCSDGDGESSSSLLGKKGQAGVVFYDKGSYSDGWRYLEADTQDLSGTYKYGVAGETYGTTGSGKSNTETLVAKLGNDSSYAAVACSNLERTVNGVKYDDWFLPSVGEFNEMYKVKGAIGLSTDHYWTSTEQDADQAYVGSSDPYGYPKDSNNYKVRAVRAF